jgi:hypothetical protein
MEDPNSRPAAARLIDSIIKDHEEQIRQNMLKGEFRAGLSLAMKIYNALKNAGFILEGGK